MTGIFAEQAVHGLEQVAENFDARKVIFAHDVAYDRRAHRVDTLPGVKSNVPEREHLWHEYVFPGGGEARETSGRLQLLIPF